jgi:hypothetical protein
MKIPWIQDDGNEHRYIAETVRYRFIMVVGTAGRTHLWAQRSADDWATNPLAQTTCVTRRGAERLAQRFENSADTPRRLK